MLAVGVDYLREGEQVDALTCPQLVGQNIRKRESPANRVPHPLQSLSKRRRAASPRTGRWCGPSIARLASLVQREGLVKRTPRPLRPLSVGADDQQEEEGQVDDLDRLQLVDPIFS